MMVKPSVSDLLNIVDDRYKLVIVTAKRAREISNGATILTDMKDENSKVTIAANEIAEGKVNVVC